MIELAKGDFFDYDADIRVNTVNCVGVMGKGVALQFKARYPRMFKEYLKVCSSGLLRPGEPHVWVENSILERVIVINFPTKLHWRNPSKYEYIESGLCWLRSYLSDRLGMTVTLPALGCGHGGLDWDIVREMIYKYLGDLEVNILLFNPLSSRGII